MRLTTLTCMAVVLGVGFGGVARAADEGTPLDPDKCKALWTMASPNGDTLSEDQAVPYVINFTMVDADGDGKISAAEFTKGCGLGLIKEDQGAPDQDTVKDME
jgi:hypothetical protein